MKSLFRQVSNLLILAVALGVAQPVVAQFSILETYAEHTYAYGKDKQGKEKKLPYRLMTIPDHKNAPLPLVLFLHGSGQSGSDNLGPIKMFEAFHKAYLKIYKPIMVLVPQCPVNAPWVRRLAFSPNYRLPPKPSTSLQAVKDLIDQWVREKKVNPDRIYIIGASLGAFATWDATQRWPNYFAAAIPICGASSMQEKYVKAAAKTPTWAFHGDVDPNVPVECSRRITKALIKLKAPCKYTEYPKAGHIIWHRVLADPVVMKWLLAQDRSAPTQKPKTPGFITDFINHFRPQ